METNYHDFKAFKLAATLRAEVDRNHYFYVKRPSIIQAIEERFEFWDYQKTFPKCEHEGCDRHGSVKCVIPNSDRWSSLAPDIIEYYCCQHAQEEGFCPGCGNYWAGSGEFESNNGWCDTCYGEICAQMADERSEAEEFGIDVFDLPY